MAYSNTVLTAGVNGFYVDGTLFPLGSVALSIPSSDVAALVYVDKVGALTTMKPIGYYKDSGGTAFNQTTLTAFYSEHMTASAGGGITSLTAGTGLSGGTITTSGTISLLQQGVSDAMAGGTVNVICASCTTNSIILVQEVQDAGTPTGIAQIVVTRNNGSFDITNVRATSDGNKFMYQVFKY